MDCTKGCFSGFDLCCCNQSGGPGISALTKTLFTESSATILQALLPMAVILFVMYLIQTGCKYYVSYQGHMMGARMESDMRQQLFDHYEKLSFSYYNKN